MNIIVKAFLGLLAVMAMLVTLASVAGAATVSPPQDLRGYNPPAGTVVQLNRGETYTGPFRVSNDNVQVTAVGTGSLPVVKAAGRYDSSITLAGNTDSVDHVRAATSWTTSGWPVGFDLTGDNEVMTYDQASGFYAGTYIETGSSGDKVSYGNFSNETIINGQGSAGAMGVLLWGDHAWVAHNTLNNNNAPSPQYGRDGSGVEVYGGAYNYISYNSGNGDNAFTELGRQSGQNATDNHYNYNNVTNTGPYSSEFLVTRGSGDTSNGPVFRTFATGNTVCLPHSGNQGAVSYDYRSGDGTLLTLTNNSIKVNGRALSQDGGYVDGGGNTLVSGATSC